MAIICECCKVSKEEVESTIKEMQLTNLDDVETFTMAGGCCGKCKDDLKKLLK